MWSAIRTILNNNTSKCLIVEDGEPKYVLLPYEEYQQLQKGDMSGIVRENSKKESIEEVNWKIQDIKEGEGLRIEDLPF